MKHSMKAYLCIMGTAAVLGAMTPAVYAQEEATEQTETQEASAEKTAGTQSISGKAPDEESETAAQAETEADGQELADGVYSAKFDTDSSMFHVNEANDGRGMLTVEDGQMTIHVSLASKGILNLYAGLAEDAKKEGAKLLEPTEDEVTYSDGYTETVYGFDIPVPALEEEFDVALIGKKGKWYDHKVSVSDPVPQDNKNDSVKTVQSLELADGCYTAAVTLGGGSGKSTVTSPAQITIEDGEATAVIEWSSPNYDYMIVDGEKYLPVNTDGNSVFEIPVSGFDGEMAVTADTVAMSTPHEIEYTFYFDSATIEKADK